MRAKVIFIRNFYSYYLMASCNEDEYFNEITSEVFKRCVPHVSFWFAVRIRASLSPEPVTTTYRIVSADGVRPSARKKRRAPVAHRAFASDWRTQLAHDCDCSSSISNS